MDTSAKRVLAEARAALNEVNESYARMDRRRSNAVWEAKSAAEARVRAEFAEESHDLWAAKNAAQATFDKAAVTAAREELAERGTPEGARVVNRSSSGHSWSRVWRVVEVAPEVRS